MSIGGWYDDEGEMELAELETKVNRLETALRTMAKGKLSVAADGGHVCAWCGDAHYYHRANDCPRIIAERALFGEPAGEPDSQEQGEPK